jgi:hypothetical protein
MVRSRDDMAFSGVAMLAMCARSVGEFGVKINGVFGQLRGFRNAELFIQSKLESVEDLKSDLFWSAPSPTTSQLAVLRASRRPTFDLAPYTPNTPTMLPSLRTRSPLLLRRTALRTYSTGVEQVSANDPKAGSRPVPQNVSATNAVPTSSEGNFDKVLVESVEAAEEMRTMQAPNRKGIWSRSQQPREKAMVGPRFEQMIMEDQVWAFCPSHGSFRAVLCSI